MYQLSKMKAHQGFTLIELMVVIMIVAILAAVGIPSYRQFVVQNAEEETKAKMLSLSTDLQKWRASTLTYRNFEPRSGTNADGEETYGYIDNDNTIIYVPEGSDATNYHYQIILVDGQSFNSLVSANATTINNALGKSWKAFAEPRPDSPYESGFTIVLSSSGLKCQTKDSTVTINSTGCGTGAESW